MDIKFSECQTFLEVDDMKFMTIGSHSQVLRTHQIESYTKFNIRKIK